MRDKLPIRVWQVLLGGAATAAWEGGARLNWLDPFFFSRPSSIASRAASLVSKGEIWPHLGTTLLEALLAFVLGSLAGVLLGFLLARRDWW